MKRQLLALACTLFIFVGFAQSDVTLKINHKLGVEDFELGVVATNNLGHQFKSSRLEYYITRITIVHDGGMETAVSDEIVALVQPQAEISTSIPLGSYDVTTIEGVKFHIGVYAPLNNEDPALWDVSHPLGPKSPSMHWGWASGYRFIAYHGFSGDDFFQIWEFHGLGNDNYFEVESEVWVETDGENITMSLNGDYAAGLNNIELSSGAISHGETGGAKKVLENWRDLVFGLYTAGLEDEEQASFNWSVFPNPSNGALQVNFANPEKVTTIKIVNSLGEVIRNVSVVDAKTKLELNTAGTYFIAVLDQQGETIATRSIVVQ